MRAELEEKRQWGRACEKQTCSLFAGFLCTSQSGWVELQPWLFVLQRRTRTLTMELRLFLNHFSRGSGSQKYFFIYGHVGKLELRGEALVYRGEEIQGPRHQAGHVFIHWPHLTASRNICSLHYGIRPMQALAETILLSSEFMIVQIDIEAKRWHARITRKESLFPQGHVNSVFTNRRTKGSSFPKGRLGRK